MQDEDSVDKGNKGLIAGLIEQTGAQVGRKRRRGKHLGRAVGRMLEPLGQQYSRQRLQHVLGHMEKYRDVADLKEMIKTHLDDDEGRYVDEDFRKRLLCCFTLSPRPLRAGQQRDA